MMSRWGCNYAGYCFPPPTIMSTSALPTLGSPRDVYRYRKQRGVNLGESQFAFFCTNSTEPFSRLMVGYQCFRSFVTIPFSYSSGLFSKSGLLRILFAMRATEKVISRSRVARMHARSLKNTGRAGFKTVTGNGLYSMGTILFASLYVFR